MECLYCFVSASSVFTAVQRMQSHSIHIFISLCTELAMHVACLKAHVTLGEFYLSVYVLS